MEREKYIQDVRIFMKNFMEELRSIAPTRRWNVQRVAEAAMWAWWMTYPPAWVDLEDAFHRAPKHQMHWCVVREAALAAVLMAQEIADEIEFKGGEE